MNPLLPAVDRNGFYAALKAEQTSVRGIVGLLVLFSLASSILAGLNDFVFYGSKLGSMDFSYDPGLQGLQPGLDSMLSAPLAAGYGVLGFLRWSSPPKSIVSAVGLTVLAAGYVAKTVLLAAILYFLARFFGLTMRLKDVLNMCVRLLTIPLAVSAFSTAVNVLSYALIGDVSVLNTVLTPAAGLLLYYLLIAEGFVKLGGLSTRMSLLTLSPFMLLAVLSAALGVWFNFVYINQVIGQVLWQLGI